MIRKALIERNTAETQIKLELQLDRKGRFQGSCGIGFLDHMLTLLAKHGRMDISLEATGDREVDDHHIVEDIGICLGQALLQSLGDKRGIVRFASIVLPMDETLLLCAVDISGRPGFYSQLEFKSDKIGTFDSELIAEFWRAFSMEGKITLHVKQLAGENAHHIAEATFKGVGRILREALRIENDDVPSTKGVI